MVIGLTIIAIRGELPRDLRQQLVRQVIIGLVESKQVTITIIIVKYFVIIITIIVIIAIELRIIVRATIIYFEKQLWGFKQIIVKQVIIVGEEG